MMKRILCLIILTGMIFISLGQVAGAEVLGNESTGMKAVLSQIPIYKGDQKLSIQTLTYNQRVYVPLRDICTYFQSDLKVDEQYKSVQILKGSQAAIKQDTKGQASVKASVAKSVYLAANPYNIQLDSMDTYINPVLYENKTYVPIRFFAELFNQKVEWVAKENKVLLSPIQVKMIGSVNGMGITLQDFNYFYNPNVEMLKNNAANQEGVDLDKEIKGLKDEIFDDLVVRNILSQKLTENKIQLDQEDIQQLNYNLSQVIAGSQGMDNLRYVLTKYDTTFYQVMLYVKNNYLYSKLKYELIKDVTASDDKIKQYYEQNKSQFVEPEKVKAKHILLLTTDKTGENLDDQKKAEVKKKAEDILAKIKAGESFDDLMKANTEDPGIASYPDGYTFGKGEMVKEFEDAAFSMKVGEVSGLVETAYGYHILKLDEKIPEKQLALDEVKQSIKQKLDNDEKNAYYTKLLDQWKSESKIENKMESK